MSFRRQALRCVVISCVLILSVPGMTGVVRGGESAPRLRSFYLDGDDFNGLRLQIHPELDLSNLMSIEIWVRRDDASRCETLLSRSFTDSVWLGFCSNRIRLYVGGGVFVDGNTDVPDGEWVHIAVTYDGTWRRYYVNGELDIQTNLNPGAIGPTEQAWLLGFDPDGFKFKGHMDELRIWNRVRTQDEIRADMYRSIDPQAGLVTNLRLDGDFTDSAIGNDVLHIGGEFVATGVIPREMIATRSNATLFTVDGICSAVEYGTADRVILDNWWPTRAFITHSADDLYVCVENLPLGSRADSFVGVMLDLDRDGGELAGPGDIRFLMSLNGTSRVQVGDGAGSYSDIALPGGSWSAKRISSEFTWTAEFRIARSVLDVPDTWERDDIGIDIGHFWENFIGDDSHWPIDGSWNVPSKWATLIFSRETESAPRHRFVVRVVDDDTEEPIRGVEIEVYAATSTSTTFAARGVTAPDGTAWISYRGYAPAHFLVQEVDPRGYYSVGAEASGFGEVVSSNSVRIRARNRGGTYDRATFRDMQGLRPSSYFDRHLLIVHSDEITPQDLHPLVDFKRSLGFYVETKTYQSIEASVAGRDRAEKIRNWLRGRWLAHRSGDMYALLIGSGDRIPVRDWGWHDKNHRDPEGENYAPAWPTDWYYADLDSDFDRDGDGYFGEFFRCAPGATYTAPDDDMEFDCPPEGSLLREGAFGALAGPDDDFLYEMATGRVPQESGKRGILDWMRASIRNERSGSLVKRRVMMAGAMWGFDGRTWVIPEEGDAGYVDGGHEDSNSALYYAWDDTLPFGLDGAAPYENGILPITSVFAEPFRLYNITNPYGEASLGPSGSTPDMALTSPNFLDQWQDVGYGLVHATGHGNPDGIADLEWINDWNENRKLENPASPDSCEADICWELSGWRYFVNENMQTTADVLPGVFANACSTGAVCWSYGRDSDGNIIDFDWGPDAIAGKMLRDEKAVFWLGGLTVTAVGRMDPAEEAFAGHLFRDSLLAGDSAWLGLRESVRRWPHDARSYTMTYFGDPSYSYWGNPVDTRSLWPQAGRDWGSTSSSPASGPHRPVRKWRQRSGSPSGPAVVDAAGLIYSVGVNRVFKFRSDGEVAGGSTQSGTAIYSPALTTDGLWVVSGPTIQSFDRDLRRRATFSLGGSATGAPRVDGAGVVWVPTTLGMTRVSGNHVPEILEGGQALGEAAFAPTNEVVWPSTGGKLSVWSQNQRGESTLRSTVYQSVSRLTSAAIYRDGKTYFGTDRGRLYQVLLPDGTPGGWNRVLGAPITAKPAIDSSGNVYVGDGRGRVTSYTPDGIFRWANTLNIGDSPPIVADPVVDGRRIYIAAGSRLYAMDLSTGHRVWSKILGAGTDQRSTPVITGDHLILVTTVDSALIAIGPSDWLMPPSFLDTKIDVRSLTLSWRDNSSGEVGFLIEAKENGGSWTPVGATLENRNSIQFGQVSSNSSMSYRVQAIGVTALIQQPNQAPQGGGAGIVGAAGGGAVVELPEPPARRGGVTGLSPEILETSAGTRSSEFAYLEEPVVTLPGTPLEPLDLEGAGIASDAVLLSWSENPVGDKPTSYCIDRATPPQGPFVRLGSVDGGTQEFVDRESLDPGTTYLYRVVAKNRGGDSKFSEIIEATTLDDSLLAPKGFQARSLNRRVMLTWESGDARADHYRIERQDPGVAGYRMVGIAYEDSRIFIDEIDLASGDYSYCIRSVGEEAESPRATAQVYVTGFEPTDPPPVRALLRGDVNQDGSIDVSDPILLLLHLFSNYQIVCEDAADIADEGHLSVTSAIYALNFLFRGGARPPAPYPDCGYDDTPDSLDCENAPGCP